MILFPYLNIKKRIQRFKNVCILKPVIIEVHSRDIEKLHMKSYTGLFFSGKNIGALALAE
jgi:hypothetical protein